MPEAMDLATGIPQWVNDVAGAEPLSAYLRALGRNATTVRVPEKTYEDDAPASSWRERHLVVLSHSPIHLVSLYAARVGPRTVSLAHHYVVRVDKDATTESTYDTKVGQSFKGLFVRSRTRLSFVGGRLARQLQADVGLRSALMKHLPKDDDVHIVPDLRRGLVRVVHVHPLAARRPLIRPDATSFHERFLPEGLLTALERIALHVRTVVPARAPVAATGT